MEEQTREEIEKIIADYQELINVGRRCLETNLEKQAYWIEQLNKLAE